MKNYDTKHLWYLMVPISAAIAILIAIALSLRLGFFPRAELFIGMLIILGVGVLLVLLTIMTVIFASLNLTDSTQALGLPEGSIRALIALILLLVFIIVGIYLYSTVGVISTSTTLTIEGEPSVLTTTAPTPEGERLALQLLTTIGTLVVAVAGFYFGTSAVSAARGITASPSPIIRNLEPREGAVGEELHLKIIGKNFRLPKTVRLVRGSKEIVSTSITSSDTEIHCSIEVPADAQADTEWDLIIVNEDGGEDMLSEAFLVNSSSS